MQRVMFFNFDYMGLGGLWQNISWLLCNQKTEISIDLCLNDRNYSKWCEILTCFQEPKYPLIINKKSTIHLDVDHQLSWQDNLKNLKAPGYSQEEIQTIPCTLRHTYYPTKFERNPQNHICYYTTGPEEIYNGHDYTLPRNVSEEIIQYLDNPVQLGNHMSIEENCKLISTSKYCIGREGGWTHVAHSSRTDYYPVMPHRHSALDYAHGKENKYLKQFQSEEEFINGYKS
jgi:hypothetical protein